MKNSVIPRVSVLFVMIWLGISVVAGSVIPVQAFTLEDEQRLGKEFYDKIKETGYLLKEDDPLTRYVNVIGQSLVEQDYRYPLDFTFSVIRSSGINAFATPGGYIYVFTGLVMLAENESQLAGVLAHEIAHVKARHIAQMIAKSKQHTIASLAAILAGALLGGGEAAAALMGLSTAASATLSLKYSREHEEEADRLGMAYLTGNGYSGQGMLDFLKIMRFNQYYSNSVPSYFLTHPETTDRIRYLTLLLQTRYNQTGEKEIVGNFSRLQTKLYLSSQSPRDNRQYFSERARQNPDDVEPHYGLAVSESKMGRFDAARQAFIRALELSPSDPEITRDFGISYFEQGDIQNAVEKLKKAHSLGATDRGTFFYLAKSYETAGDFKTALDLYRKISDKDPEDSEIYYNLAMMYGKIENLGESHYYFGKYFKVSGRSESALFHFKKALDYLPPDNARTADVRKEMESLGS